ncbi:Asp23/Gls24 family envelope stress response protein [Leuconostoc suionicum]|uniref:Asp23/Gls24 family envelope stress response protein n=1 Tax=Leuconostoc suionicum TaxID=1511761 RepID=UPI00233E9577|nr:Asp23/Gls24 family envelope stress response protein [Leuconostoc suionicum]MDC2805128.1 Asp23/Gls24 family envelope stress response protein [Leuconostoc suionicum]MDC2822640.1 Asp23/Gls24 family envelope stress response protein [Leuconostoc suionicum]
MVTENKGTQSTSTDVKGELTFNDKVIQKIVGYAIENVKGLLGVDGGFVSNIKNKIVNSDDPTDGINVEVGKEQVAVDLDVIMEFGHNAHDIYKELIKVIETQLEKATNLKLVELNVQIIDIQTQAEYKNSRVTLQDKVSDAGSAIKEKTSDGVNSAKETANNLTDDDSRVK